MWILGRRGLAAGAWILLVAAGPAYADGLSKFNEQIKAKLPPGALTYKNAKALGDNGFALEDVVVTPPPDTTGGSKAEPIKIHGITVEDFDFDSIAKQAPPNFMRMRIDGVEIAQKPAEGIDLGALAGIDKFTADFQFDYRIDPAKKTLVLSRFEVNLNGLARLELSMTLDNFVIEASGQPDKAMTDTTLRTASLVYDDHTLLAKLMPAGAKMQGSDPSVLIAMGKGFLDGLRTGQGDATQKVFDAVESYMEDYATPKGTLRLTFNPPGKITAATITGASGADDVIKGLGLTVDYAGTRKQEVAAAPAAPAPGATPAPGAAPKDDAGKLACTAGARMFVWSEGGWSAATVRETAKSGDKCVVRIEGASDDVSIPPDKTMAWNIDGPGKAVTKCDDGTKVLVETDGTWYPAKITDRPATEGNCPVKYEDPKDDPEAVPLKRIRTLK